MRGRDEALRDGAVEEGEQRREVAVGVEQRARLRVEAELAPGEHLEPLLQRADPAGQRDECVGACGHLRLAFVHRVHDEELGESAMRQLLGRERARQHADHAPAARERGIGERTHQADARAAVHEIEPARGDRLASRSAAAR
jgi:hypothetical protein